MADTNEENMSGKDYFPFDPDVTDLALIVEGKTLHVSKLVLMDASPVFRKMFTGDFKEKSATELELPGKKYSTWVLFLRCIFPREYVTINENEIGDLLPLAHEYNVGCVLRKCETWLMTEFDFKAARASYHFVNDDNNVTYFMKCLYYGVEYDLKELYDKVLPGLIPYRLIRYAKNEFYKLLPEQNKREILENRLSKLDGSGKYVQESYATDAFYKINANLFI